MVPGKKSSRRGDQQRTSGPSPARGNTVKPDLFASFDTGSPVDMDASFAEIGVPEVLIKELSRQGIDSPFPIQTATMADCLDGRDVLGRGRTGSGKTLAFVLPLLTTLAKSTKPRRAGRPRALILVPTRELALQIQTVMAPYAKALALTTTTIFGGVGASPQIRTLRGGVDVVIACPGRLLDHVQTGVASLDAVEITVLDEADHMADMGFLPGVKKLLDRTPRQSQRLLFSATLDNGVSLLVSQYLTRPVLRSVDPVESVEVKMTHHVLEVSVDSRFSVLRDLAAAPGRIIVFTRTKHGAKKLTSQLVASGVPAVEMHGNLGQNVRVRNLEAFRSGAATAMVATDIAARGIHVDDIGLVVHFDPPVDHKAYLHRSGRTARAGAEGIVVTLMLPSQLNEVRDLSRQAGISPTVTRVDPSHPLLREIAPGDRVFVEPARSAVLPATPRAGRPAAGRASAGRPPKGRPGPERERSASERSASERSGSERSGSERPGSDRRGLGRPDSGRPASGRPASGRPASEGATSARPASGRPASGRPASGRPANRSGGPGRSTGRAH